MLKVKICGITNLEDALLAEKLETDMLGFIFYRKSPRYLSSAKAERIIAALSPLTRKVGVFVNEPAEKLLRTAGRLKLDFVQLAGDENNAYVKKIQKQIPVIKAFRVGEDFQLPLLQKSPAALNLADTRADGLYGGSGKSFDWRKLTSLKGDERLILAGGIGAENLREAYEILQPAAVDLTSSVEARPGKKDAVKLKQFFEVANEIRFGR
ncbi:MAG TPA: phosphoribosylanthranilate isomerase [candidate division Zixibacteria bacterium]|nr:phosphoribosylanthranilate isomerase [candidate division Zixibacteria bacterium]